ncbi:MAG TPA: protein-glutamate O-methyltransferase CheR [Labilithrix sp.]|nr:protein-glutamate O-methyltransferase CheR [Labilithrix sp.]
MMKKTLFGSRAGEPQLRLEEYRLLRDLVSERLGVWFGPESRSSLERRLRERLNVRGLTSFADYYQLLKYSPLATEEWDEAADILTTHETYFFREDYQLRAFQHELLPMLAARPRRRIQVWSAGCSTGEEAYTIAMLMLESGLFDPARGWEVRVYGSDLSKKCIASARRGVYGPASFRVTSADARAKWFVRQPSEPREFPSTSVPTGPYYGVSPEVRTLCHFTQMNLLDEERTPLVGRCDVIFCRNVVIYFDAAARRRVIDMFYERLVPGGVLLLGHSESLLNVTTAFELLHLKEDLVYRKPLLASSVK